MNDTQSKHRMLVETLYTMTTEKRLDWKNDAFLSGFATVVGNHIINIDYSMGQFEENDYFVKILDGSYNEVEAFSDIDISDGDSAPGVGNFRNHYLLLDSLYKTVRRQVSGADDALDSILKSLSQI